jgi:hypothetical protein
LDTTQNRLPAEVGADKGSNISADIWVSDVARYPEMTDVWEHLATAESASTRATVESGPAAHGYKVEIRVEAT